MIGKIIKLNSLNIVSEAHEGYFYDFSEFCGSLGYDEDSREAERIYKACGKEYDKLSKIGLTDEDDYVLFSINNIKLS